MEVITEPATGPESGPAELLSTESLKDGLISARLGLDLAVPIVANCSGISIVVVAGDGDCGSGMVEIVGMAGMVGMVRGTLRWLYYAIL